MKDHNQTSDQGEAYCAPARFKRIKNSGTEYGKGGVFEASHFAKGDGWSSGKPAPADTGTARPKPQAP